MIYSNEEAVKKNNKLNVLVLLGVNLLLPILLSMYRSEWTIPYVFVFASMIMLYYKKTRRFFKYLIAFVIFRFLATMPIPESAMWLSFFSMTFFIIYQFLPMMMIGSLLFFDYQTSEILSALQSIHLPRKIIIAITIAIRYVPTFREEFRLIKNCMYLRGIGFSWKKPIQSFSYFIVPQLFRCSLLAEELTSAGLTKGIDSKCKRTSIFEHGWHWYDTVVFGGFLLGMFFVIRYGGSS
ncbi:MAG: energy-coupling factor transporter transmembrane component T [Peptostreptococcaceae bacterium]|nr:energy-coupling factor transporter transmembrane component T [Peptostreptococcaceae bacterium]